MKLSLTMQRAVTFAQAHGGKLVRHPGGYWSSADFIQHRSTWFGTATAEALVSRGVGYYSSWKDGRDGRFPVEITIGAPPVPPRLSAREGD